MRSFRLILLVMALSQLAMTRVSATSPNDEVRAALLAMHVWVGEDDNALAWKRFLRSDDLVAEIDKGAAADPATLRSILDIYEGTTPGLHSPRFVAVRDALRLQVAERPLSEVSVDVPLLDQIRGAKGKARPVTEEHLAEAKAQLLADAAQLEQFFMGGSAENAAKWRGYLNWESMQAELVKADRPNLNILNRSLMTYRENHVGLELDHFTRVRDSLRLYMNRILFSSNADFSKAYDQQIDQLAESLERYADKPTEEDAIQIGKTLGWFERAGQISSLVDSVRSEYSHPNLLITASESLVGAGFRDAINRTQGVNEFILGTTIRGTSRLQATLDLELLPSSDRAAFNIVMQGVALSTNRGTNRGVTIYSTARSNLGATKTVYADAKGVSAVAAQGRATTSTNITCIQAGSGLVRKIAWKRALQSKSTAERIASNRAASKVAGQVDSETASLMSETNERINTKLRNPLIRRESFPSLNVSTTTDQLLVGLLHATRFQIAAPGPAPPLDGDHDVKARVHQSAVGNFSESLLGGELLTDERIVKMYEEGELELPDDLKLDDEADPWGITFARTRPIAVRFNDGSITVMVRCQSLHRGSDYNRVNLDTFDAEDNPFRPEIHISREYKLTTPNGGLQLVAKGDLALDFVSPTGEVLTKYSLLHTSAKGLLVNKFGAMLTQKLPQEENDGFVLPGRWERAGKLKTRVAASADGWLLVGLQQTATEVAENVAQEEPPLKIEQTASISP